ncbi:MAG: ABC transporter permease [Parafilimonas sp.]|nr:ABC transporter permease [Parafilimonas sp.]
MLAGIFTKPENLKVYWKEFLHQCVEIGFRSLPIVSIISVFLGAVSTLQTSYQLKSPLIPKSTIAKVVRDSVILEFSPTLISIVLAGVIGSRIAGELGNMRVSEQIDALEMMGINTKSYLILPKMTAALLMVPCLVIISIMLAIFGGREVGSLLGIIATHTFDAGLRSKLNFSDICFSLSKAFTFAFIISTVPAYFGYYVVGGSINIGRASTKAVIVSCILILIFDYVLASLLL